MVEHFYTLGAVAPFRSLVIAHVLPWPAVDGYRQRLSNMIEALAAVGEVDFFCTEARPVVPIEAPPGVRLVRATGSKRSGFARAARWVTGSTPRELDGWDLAPATEVFRHELRLPYDVVLFSHLSAWHNFADLLEAPAIVDVDNLDSIVLRARAAITASGGATGPVGSKHWLRRWVDRVDAGRMERLERRCAANVDAMLLCSELDVRRSGFPNALVIANGFTRVSDPPDRGGLPARRELFFVGQLAYEPNQDAVRWFANEVLPLVLEQVPDARFRVVGRNAEAVADLAALTGVDLVGPVDDLREELERAVVSVVPIRFGAGTRLKVLEALASRIPIVSTAIGCEGIDVVDGIHALVADDARSFAAACVRALTDAELRRSLEANGEALWDDRYRWSTIRGRLADVARQVAADG